jgi:hypothetical protein
MSAFTVDLKNLRKRDKSGSDATVAKADAAGENTGFVDRSAKAPRGRPKSPRTGQVHAKVLPGIETEIAEEATRRGVTQGVILEEAWALYKADSRRG